MPKKGQSSLGEFNQIGYKTRYELQIFKSPFRVLATHKNKKQKYGLNDNFPYFWRLKTSEIASFSTIWF